MAFLRNVFGRGKKGEAPTAPAATGPRVSANRYWRCPNCGAVQRKKELDTVFVAGAAVESGPPVACSQCAKEHAAVDVYGGRFDFTGEVETLSRVQIAQKYLDAEMAQDADALEALLAPDAVHSSMRGDIVGAKAIAARLRGPQGPGAGMIGRLQWGRPVEEDGKVKVDGTPSMANAPFPGLTLTLTFNEAGKIARIEMGRKQG